MLCDVAMLSVLSWYGLRRPTWETYLAFNIIETSKNAQPLDGMIW